MRRTALLTSPVPRRSLPVFCTGAYRVFARVGRWRCGSRMDNLGRMRIPGVDLTEPLLWSMPGARLGGSATFTPGEWWVQDLPRVRIQRKAAKPSRPSTSAPTTIAPVLTTGGGHVNTPDAGPMESVSEHLQPTAVAETLPQVHGSCSQVSPSLSVPLLGVGSRGCWAEAGVVHSAMHNRVASRPTVERRIMVVMVLKVGVMLRRSWPMRKTHLTTQHSPYPIQGILRGS